MKQHQHAEKWPQLCSTTTSNASAQQDTVQHHSLRGLASNDSFGLQRLYLAGLRAKYPAGRTLLAS